MSIHLDFILYFFHASRGKRPQMRQEHIPCRQKDYVEVGVPTELIPASMFGVTLGIGCKLGQWMEKELEMVGVDETFSHRLDPYWILGRRNALEVLRSSLLMLSQKESNHLDKALIHHCSSHFTVENRNELIKQGED